MWFLEQESVSVSVCFFQQDKRTFFPFNQRFFVSDLGQHVKRPALFWHALTLPSYFFYAFSIHVCCLFFRIPSFPDALHNVWVKPSSSSSSPLFFFSIFPHQRRMPTRECAQEYQVQKICFQHATADGLSQMLPATRRNLWEGGFLKRIRDRFRRIIIGPKVWGHFDNVELHVNLDRIWKSNYL